MKKKSRSKTTAGAKGRRKRLSCFFCENPKAEIAYENTSLISRFLTSRGKIIGRVYSGNCARHQKRLTRAIKQARALALLPYTEIHALN